MNNECMLLLSQKCNYHVSGKMNPHSKKFSLTSVLNGFSKQILCKQLLIKSSEI